MQFTSTQRAAAKRAMELNLPFALFALPGESEYRFFASKPDDNEGNMIAEKDFGPDIFLITGFCSPIVMASVVRRELTADDVLALPADTEVLPPSEIVPSSNSTPFRFYAAQVHKAVSEIRRRKMEKVVLSRLIAATTERHPVDIAEEYFGSLPRTFRAIFFTQESGLWITATPELLLADLVIPDGNPEDSVSVSGEYVMPVSQFESMALAGTRDASAPDGEEWDAKNTVEHNKVLDFITSVFSNYGLEPEVTEEKPVTFGGIEHKIHRIRSRGRCNSMALADALSPTPALAGYPLHTAVKFIAASEDHPRDCYGGLVAVVGGDEMRAYVNIRCAMVSTAPDSEGRYLVNIHAGGGIMADSDYRSEWREAAGKAMPLYRLVNPDNPGCIAEIPEAWLSF